MRRKGHVWHRVVVQGHKTQHVATNESRFTKPFLTLRGRHRAALIDPGYKAVGRQTTAHFAIRSRMTTFFPPQAVTVVCRSAVYRWAVLDNGTALRCPICLVIFRNTPSYNMLGGGLLHHRPNHACAKSMEKGCVLQFGDDGPLVRPSLLDDGETPSLPVVLRQTVPTVEEALDLYLAKDPTRIVVDYISKETRKRKREVTFACVALLHAFVVVFW